MMSRKKKAYLEFVENVQPQLKKIGFELDKKIVSSPHLGDLERARYEVMLRLDVLDRPRRK